MKHPLFSYDSEAGLPDGEFQKKVLGGVECLQSRNESLTRDVLALKAAANKQALEISSLRAMRSHAGTRAPSGSGLVSEACAQFFTASALTFGLRTGKIVEARTRDFAEATIKDVLGMESRTALSSSDIPLPTEYNGEVVELVNQYGTARKWGTVFPLGTGVVKLPRLKTDDPFTLLAQSSPITEKSPQTEWVTFTPEKFGGLIRLPSEIDADSIVPMGQFLANYAARNLARAEDWNFWCSTGAASGVNGTAEGLTKAVVTNSKTTVSGTLGSPSEFTVTHFRTLRNVCDPAALRRGAYYMHPSFEGLLAGMNSSGARPYNPQAQIVGSGAMPFVTAPTLDGFPVRWVDSLPVYTTADALSTVHVLFGDVSFNYLGTRGEIRLDTSRDAGFSTDEILVRALERFTVGLMATGAVAGLITHSS